MLSNLRQGVSLSSETSSSSTSPSPGHPKNRHWNHHDAGGTSSSSSSSVILNNKTALHGRRAFASRMSLDETDSSDDSTYSSQYQSDANSTPRTGTSHTLPRNLPSSTVVKVKSMTDYESEILQMRSDMEQLQVKLTQAESQLKVNQREHESNEVVQRLMKEEDKLRREHLDLQMASEDPMSDKERMILMQQKKIAALDAANRRLLEELNRMTSQKVSVTTNPVTVTSINTSSPPDRRVSSSSSSSNKSITVITNGEATTKSNSLNASATSQETPKTVDELLDSLHSTSI